MALPSISQAQALRNVPQYLRDSFTDGSCAVIMVEYFQQPLPVRGKMKSAKTVLVIEDTRELRELLCCLLEARGFEVRCCEDGVSALKAAAETTFHVIITDYRMPNMNGIDATKHLRKRFPASLIIGVSSDDMGKAFLAAGADAFLMKPYRAHDIFNLMIVER